ncbi:Ku protein [Phreatobacter sp.]|uniref:non-homologous end joining protein Ku n=1 Tax=Phreatobacter sp. TaxID=1966341 RepID=UPI0025ED66F9|nr:Ku protein [Phreatobacter sp.]
MAGTRANWKGFLKIGELSCPVGLYTAASTSSRIAFHTINRKTGNRVRREFVDPATGKPVPRQDQVKGYALDDDRVVMLEPEEIARAVPGSDKTLSVEAFIPCNDIDTLYFDRPYFLAPSGRAGQEAFAVIREAMGSASVAALARAVLFRRVRALMLRADDEGLIAHTLNYDYEVRSAADAFSDLPDIRIKKEMLDLARHIVSIKAGTFDPSTFDDRYEEAVATLVMDKLAGKTLKRPKEKRAPKVVDLLGALRESAAGAGGPTKGRAKSAVGASKAKSKPRSKKAA